MEENNNQNNENNQSNNKILIILMAIIIVGLIGYIVYAKFIEKEPIKPKDNNTQENSNQQTNDNTGKEQNINDNKVLRKMMIISSDSCQNLSEIFNNIKVEAIMDNEAYECGHKVLVNGNYVLEYAFQIKSIEFYDDYVIISYSDTGNSWIKIFDTKDIEKEYETSVKGYYFPEYVSDDEGIIIDAHYTELFGDNDPGSRHAKIRIPYVNGKFGSPIIIEKYD